MNKNRGIKVWRFACVAVMLWALIAAGPASTAETETPRPVRVGMYGFSPLVFQEEDGTVKGLLVDALERVAALENWRFQYVYGSRSQSLERLRSGNIDLLVGIGSPEQRDGVPGLNQETARLTPVRILLAVPEGQDGRLMETLERRLFALSPDSPSSDQRLHDAWLVPVDQGRSPSGMVWPVVVSVGLMVLFVVWNLKLRAQARTRAAEVTERTRQMEEQVAMLAQTNRYLQDILDNSPDAIGIVDPSGRFITWNRMAVQIYGFSLEDFNRMGMKAFDLYAHQDELEKMLTILRREGSIKGYEIDMKKRDGSIVPVELSISLLQDETNRNIGSVCVARDLSVIKKTLATLWETNDRLRREATERKKAKEALRESEKRYRTIFENTGSAMVIVESDTTISLANTEFERLSGYSKEELQGIRSWTEFVSEEDRKRMEEYNILRRIDPGRVPHQYEFGFTNRKGEARTIFLNVAIIPGTGASVASLLDITERKMAEMELDRAKNYLENVLENSPDAIGIVDKQGRFIKWNTEAERLYGYSFKEMEGKHFADLYADEAVLDAMLAQLRREGAVKKREINMKTGNGAVVPFELSISLLRDENGKTVGSVCVARDLSEIRKALTELKTAYGQLQAAKEAAEAANRAKSIFLANMSHEIRTPLNAVIGLSYLTLQTELTSQQMDYQHKIHSSANSLLRLINDILDFSKIEAGRLDLENRDFSLKEVLESMSAVINVKSAEKGLSFSVEVAESTPTRLVGDSLRLRQVLTNLVSNAVKFTHEGEVSIVVEPVEESDEEVTLRFVVRDTGIGMVREQLVQLFQAFHQADASITRKYGGTGLGLAISKRLMEMMGGEIHVTSEPGVGTRFTCTAPFGKSKEETPAHVDSISKEQAKELLTGIHLLVVEDNEVNLQVARELLEQIGIKVTSADNGEKAVELVVKQRFDGILMDLQMPVMDGYAATRAIRSNPKFADLPIIAMTASAMTADRDKCLDAGMNDHVAKPIEPPKLYEALIRWIRPAVFFDLAASAGTHPDATSLDPAEGFPRLDGVDVRVGLSNMSGDRNLYLKVLENVFHRFRDIVQQIRAEMDREALDGARRLTHTFKGLAGTIGARELHKVSQDLESALEHQETDRIAVLMTSFSPEVDRVMAALEPLFAEKDRPASDEVEAAGESGALNTQRLKEVFGELFDLIDEGDSDALERVGVIKDLLGPSRVSEDILRLEAQIHDYEFEDARETLQQLYEELYPEG